MHYTQLVKLSESTAALRRLYFLTVDVVTGARLTDAGISAFTSVLSKNGAAAAATSNSPVEVDAGDMPGWWYIELTAAELSEVGIFSVGITAAEIEPREMICQVVAFDPYDAVRMGMTALPNAAAEAAGGLYTRGSGAGQINQPANGSVDVNAISHLGTAYATPTVAGVPEVDVTHWIGTAAATPSVAGVPEVDVTHWIGTAAATPSVAGVPEVDVTHWIGTAAATPSVAGVPEIDVTHWNGTAVATPTTAGVPRVDIKAMEANVLTAAATHADFGTEMAGAIWDALKASYNVANSFGAHVQSITAGVTTTTIRDAILNYSHDTGLTIKGAFRRMDAVLAGKATGLRSTIARFFMRDGTTVAVEATQDVANGTRATPTITGSEA